MPTISVKLDRRSYNIIVGRKIMPSLGNQLKRLNLGDCAYIITNRWIKNKYADPLIKVLKKAGLTFKIKTITDSEKSKSITALSSVICDLAKFDLQKRTFIIALGGGVVGDLSGLAASIYKRGIAYIQIPTTLLAQVDSAIGGKTAIDLKEGKNLVGAFYQPRLVFSDVALLESLSPRQLRAGLAEVIKYGIISDQGLFGYLEREYADILRLKPAALEYIVKASSKIKANIVQRDEREERGLRTILNFGHTVGHAIEAASGFNKYTHGEAIALGMLVASGISQRLGLIDNVLKSRIENLIKLFGLPLEAEKVSLKSIINAYRRDKKFIGAKNKLVLLTGLGKPKIVENIPLALITREIKSRIRP